VGGGTAAASATPVDFFLLVRVVVVAEVGTSLVLDFPPLVFLSLLVARVILVFMFMRATPTQIPKLNL
jgi:hypothetical protein